MISKMLLYMRSIYFMNIYPKYSESMNKSTGQEYARCNKEIDDTWKEMRRFYNFEKFDNDYLSDAVIFIKAETLTTQ